MSASAGPLGYWNMNQEGMRSSWEQSCVGYILLGCVVMCWLVLVSLFSIKVSCHHCENYSLSARSTFLSLHIHGKKIKVADDIVLLIMYLWHEQIILEHSVRVYEGMDPFISEKEAESMENWHSVKKLKWPLLDFKTEGVTVQTMWTTSSTWKGEVKFSLRSTRKIHVNGFQHLKTRGKVPTKKYQDNSCDQLLALGKAWRNSPEEVPGQIQQHWFLNSNQWDSIRLLIPRAAR